MAPANPLPTKFGLVLYPGFQLLDAAGPLDALNMLAYDHPLTLYILAPTLTPISTLNSSQKAQGSLFSQSIVPTHTFDTAPDDIEVLLVPGGLGSRGEGTEEYMCGVVEYLKKVLVGEKGSSSVKWVLTVCTGSEILARTGVLEGRRATTNKRAFGDVCLTPPFSFFLLLFLLLEKDL